AAAGGDEAAVGRHSHSDSGWEIGEGKATFVPAKVPKIAPLEPAQVRRTRLRNVSAKQRLSAFEISFVPGLLHEVHVRGVGPGQGVAPLLIDAIGDDGSADADDAAEDEDEDSWGTERGLA